MKNLKSFILGGVGFLSIISCNSSDDENTMNHNHLSDDHVSAVIKLDHSLAIGDEFVVQQAVDGVEQILVLDKFKFIISDVSVKNSDDEIISVPNNLGGNLIDLSKSVDKEVKIYLSQIPKGEYKSISFGIGVSQEVAAGNADAQSRLFDLASADMNWAWNPNSYIFSKIEATNKLNMPHHTAKTTEQADNLWIHIGKKGDFDGFRMVTLEFPQNITVKSEVSPSVHVKVNIEKLFVPDNGTSVYLGSPSKADFADNYVNIFELHHVHPLDDALSLENVESEIPHESNEGGSGHNH